MKNKKIISTSVLAALMLSLPMAAYSGCCSAVAVTSTPVMGPATSIASSSGVVATQTTTMQTLLNLNFGMMGEGYTNGLISGMDENLKAQTDVLKKLTDLELDNATFLEKATKKEEIERLMRVGKGLASLCRSGTAAKQVQQAEKKTAEKGAQLNAASTSRSTTAFSPSTKVMDPVYAHDSAYCSAAGVAANRCATVSDKANADIKASTLMGGIAKVNVDLAVSRNSAGSVIGVTETNLADGAEEVSKRLTFDEDDMEASKLLIVNTVNPIPDRALDGSYTNSPKFLTYQSLFLSRQARISFSDTALNDVLSSREPVYNLEAWKEQIKATDALAVEKLDSAAVNGLISSADKLKFEVDRRYGSSDWYTGLSGKTTTELTQEQLMLSALDLKLQYAQLQTLEDIKILMAVQLGTTVNPVSKDDLAKEMPLVK